MFLEDCAVLNSTLPSGFPEWESSTFDGTQKASLPSANEPILDTGPPPHLVANDHCKGQE
jgi:hypothetical protein